MSVPTTTFAELKNSADKTSNILKTLEAVAFLAPISAPVIDTLTDSTGALNELPEGYLPVGIVTPDGYTFGSNTETVDTHGFGYANPPRQDIVRVTKSISVTALEYRANILALAYGMQPETMVQAINGEVRIDRPVLPEKVFYRMIVIGKDGAGDDELFVAKHFPKVYSTSIPEEAWGENALQFPLELSVDLDPEVGTTERSFLAGPGAKARGTGMGFAQA